MLEQAVRDSEHRVLEYLGQTFRVNPVELARRYPLGYALFLTDGKSIYVPDKSVANQHVVVDWTRASIEFKGTEAWFVMPDLMDLTNHATVYGSTMSFVVPRYSKEPMAYSLNSVFTFDVFVEVLDDRGESMLGVVGFAPRT